MFNLLNNKAPEDLSEKDIKWAMKQTVKFLKSNPQRYDFMLIHVPGCMMSNACLSGWIGYFLNRRFNTKFVYTGDVTQALYADDKPFGDDFYSELSALPRFNREKWQFNTEIAIAALEEYIKIYRK